MEKSKKNKKDELIRETDESIRQKRCKVIDSNQTNDKSNNIHPFKYSFDYSQKRQKQKLLESKLFSQDDSRASKLQVDFQKRAKNLNPLDIFLNNRFYLFTDVVFDTKFLRDLTENKDINYSQMNATSIYKNMKYINHCERKYGHTCTEMAVDLIIGQSDIQVLKIFMDSIPNQQIHDLVLQYLNLWDLHNQYKELIRKDNAQYNEYEIKNQLQLQENPEGTINLRKERELSSEEILNEELKKMDVEKYIMYYYYKVDYHNETLENVRVGFTPALSKKLGDEEYILFQKRLMQGEYYEPLTSEFRLISNINLMEEYFQHICTSSGGAQTQPLTSNQEIDICTITGKILKARAQITRKNIYSFFDTYGDMAFRTYDLLMVFELDIPKSSETKLSDQENEMIASQPDEKMKKEQIDVIKKEVREVVSDNPYFQNVDRAQEFHQDNQYFKQEDNQNNENFRNDHKNDGDDDKDKDYSEKQNQENNNDEYDRFQGESGEKLVNMKKEEQ